jgi:sugar O-acyltransferase (sialic acid O-acetyltransferase NeuD family)
MKKIVLFGGGRHVSYCIDIIEKEKKYRIVGITDPNLKVGTEIMGYKIIGKQEEIKELIVEYKINAGIITIGDNWTRKIVYDKIISLIPDFDFISSIHPSVIIGKNTKIGKGTVIMAGCIISPNSFIGEFCFFASGAILEHDSHMGDFSSLSAGSITGGNVIIGQYSAITLGVTLFDRITIGEHVIIGSGSLVTKDIPSFVIAYGRPARVIKKRKIGEKYLK